MQADDEVTVLMAMKTLVASGHPAAAEAFESYQKNAITATDFMAFAKLIIAEQSEIQIEAAALSPPRAVPTMGPSGFLFMCSGKTYDECLRRALFGENGGKMGKMRGGQHLTQATPLLAAQL